MLWHLARKGEITRFCTPEKGKCDGDKFRKNYLTAEGAKDAEEKQKLWAYTKTPFWWWAMTHKPLNSPMPSAMNCCFQDKSKIESASVYITVKTEH